MLLIKSSYREGGGGEVLLILIVPILVNSCFWRTLKALSILGLSFRDCSHVSSGL